ncbi:hypothetical protein POM88_003983 [Heracleum sosnowskyi]|uniref:Uncharacterized protein n=1 Tax=Heracleum sosnowskyi TaxID=360622 RepID=A0AAD8JIH6_9APIA|nr:hypothetical protein POM88_003983 [Heracleum sosnowskyi]
MIKLMFMRTRQEQYIEVCQKQNVDPNQASIYTWAKAVGVQKNGIIGVPRTKAYDIIPIERSRKRHRRREDDESGASTDGRSLHMADEFVIQAVDQTVAYARAHPNEFGLAPEQVRMLEKSVSVAEGDGELPPDHPLSMGTMTELVQVMVSVLADIQARQKPDGNNGNGKSIMREDDCSRYGYSPFASFSTSGSTWKSSYNRLVSKQWGSFSSLFW